MAGTHLRLLLLPPAPPPAANPGRTWEPASILFCASSAGQMALCVIRSLSGPVLGKGGLGPSPCITTLSPGLGGTCSLRGQASPEPVLGDMEPEGLGSPWTSPSSWKPPQSLHPGTLGDLVEHTEYGRVVGTVSCHYANALGTSWPGACTSLCFRRATSFDCCTTLCHLL